MDPATIWILIVVLIVLAFLTIIPLIGLLKKEGQGTDIGVKGRWNGFGGGRGGWQITPGLTRLLLTIFFGSAFSLVGGGLLYVAREQALAAQKATDSDERLQLLEKFFADAKAGAGGCTQIVAPAIENSTRLAEPPRIIRVPNSKPTTKTTSKPCVPELPKKE
jgi:hypothetical protein